MSEDGTAPKKSRYGCAHPGCERHPNRGDLIIRVSPKGEPFEGLCAEHLREDQ